MKVIAAMFALLPWLAICLLMAAGSIPFGEAIHQVGVLFVVLWTPLSTVVMLFFAEARTS